MQTIQYAFFKTLEYGVIKPFARHALGLAVHGIDGIVHVCISSFENTVMSIDGKTI